MASAHQPLRLAANPVPREEVVGISSDEIESYLAGLSDEERARQFTAMLQIAYRGTKELVERRQDLTDPAHEAVSDLTRTFSQAGNWVASSALRAEK